MKRICTGCKQELPAASEYFHKKNGGFATRCKNCIKEYYQRYYKDNHERVLDKKNEQSKEYYDKNKEMISSRRKQQYKEGSTAKREWSFKYYKSNREKLLRKRKEYLNTEEGWSKKVAFDQLRRSRGNELPSNFSAVDWKNCKEHFDNKCAYCTQEIPLTREHFIPLVSGGEYTINNIIPACKSCNSSKKNSDFFNWYPKQSFYSKQREQKILNYLHYNNGIQQLALL